MEISVSIRKEAEADIAECYEYYESCRAHLGADLMLCIEASIERISKNPFQYKEIYKNVHRALVNRFPYGVYYVIKGENVSVIGVLHARRNPDHWKKRT